MCYGHPEMITAKIHLHANVYVGGPFPYQPLLALYVKKFTYCNFLSRKVELLK